MDDYNILNQIDQDTFSTIKLCQHKSTRKMYQVEIISKLVVEWFNIDIDKLWSDLQKLMDNPHPNIVNVVDLGQDLDNYYVLSEVVQGGKMLNRLARLKNFTEIQATYIISQLVLGLYRIHSLNIIHGCLVPDKIWLAKQDYQSFEIKISPVRFLRAFSTRGTGNMAEPVFLDANFRSPE